MRVGDRLPLDTAWERVELKDVYAGPIVSPRCYSRPSCTSVSDRGRGSMLVLIPLPTTRGFLVPADDGTLFIMVKHIDVHRVRTILERRKLVYLFGGS